MGSVNTSDVLAARKYVLCASSAVDVRVKWMGGAPHLFMISGITLVDPSRMPNFSSSTFQ
jgi:hypothetical protein